MLFSLLVTLGPLFLLWPGVFLTLTLHSREGKSLRSGSVFSPQRDTARVAGDRGPLRARPSYRAPALVLLEQRSQSEHTRPLLCLPREGLQARVGAKQSPCRFPDIAKGSL